MKEIFHGAFVRKEEEYDVQGGQDGVAIKRSHREDNDVGLNPAATKKRTLGEPPTEGCPNSLTGYEWKTSKMIAEPRVYKKNIYIYINISDGLLSYHSSIITLHSFFFHDALNI